MGRYLSATQTPMKGVDTLQTECISQQRHDEGNHDSKALLHRPQMTAKNDTAL